MHCRRPRAGKDTALPPLTAAWRRLFLRVRAGQSPAAWAAPAAGSPEGHRCHRPRHPQAEEEQQVAPPVAVALLVAVAPLVAVAQLVAVARLVAEGSAVYGGAGGE